MRESAITNDSIVDTLRGDEAAQSWARAYMKSARHSWQRNEAEVGLIARARLLKVGAWDFISIDEGASRKDARIVIHGMPFSVAAIAA